MILSTSLVVQVGQLVSCVTVYLDMMTFDLIIWHAGF